MTHFGKTIGSAILLTFALAGSLAHVGCSSSSGGDTTGTGTPGTVNNCTKAMAVDKTGSMSVEVSLVSAWTFNHQACVRVSAGTEVVWKGNFTTHPLSGGPSAKPDAASPITAAGKAVAGGEAKTKLAAAGDYPYYCVAHASTMQGVIYVD